MTLLIKFNGQLVRVEGLRNSNSTQMRQNLSSYLKAEFQYVFQSANDGADRLAKDGVFYDDSLIDPIL